MNIRQYSYITYLPRHEIEVNVQRPTTKTSFWSGEEVITGYAWKKEKIWVDNKEIVEKRLEWLNPETLKWETIPEVKEQAANISRSQLSNEGGYVYA